MVVFSGPRQARPDQPLPADAAQALPAGEVLFFVPFGFSDYCIYGMGDKTTVSLFRFPELNLQPVLPPALPPNLADLLSAQPSWVRYSI